MTTSSLARPVDGGPALPPLERARRGRAASDLVRLAVTIVAGCILLLLGTVRSGTAAGIQEDVTSAATTVPDVVIALVAAVHTLVVVALPACLVADLVLRRKWRLLGIAGIGSLVTFAAAWAISRLAGSVAPEALLETLTAGGTGHAAGSLGLLAASVTVVTIEGSDAGPRTTTILWCVLPAMGTLLLIDRRATVLALVASALLGRAVGLLTRYLAGTGHHRVGAAEVLATLTRVGLDPIAIRPLGGGAGPRALEVELGTGGRAAVRIIDPDRDAIQLVRQLSRVLRVRNWVSRTPGFSARRQAQQSAAPTLLARGAGVRTPRVLAVAEIDDRTMLLAEELPVGLRCIDVPDRREVGDDGEADRQNGCGLGDDELGEAWRQLGLLHGADVAHEGLHPGSLGLDASRQVWLLGLSGGEIAASELRRRLDRTEMLVTTALLVGTDRAVAAAHLALGATQLVTLATLLEPIALNPEVRKALRSHDGLLDELRDSVERVGAPTTERRDSAGADEMTAPVRIERLPLRTIVSVLAVTLAVYVLAGQLGDVDFGRMLADIDWRWACVAVGASLVTYAGSALTIRPFSPVEISGTRWIAAQFAADFVSLVAPAAVGSAGTNVRLIQKGGAPPGLAVASVGISTLVSLVTTVVVFLTIAGVSQQDIGLDVAAPSDGILLIVAGVVALVALAAAVPVTRRLAVARLRPFWDATGPRLLEVARDPRRLVEGVGGNLLTTLGYAVTLWASVQAYGQQIPVGVAVVVFLGAGLLGSVAPTPGGIGAVEAALVAGLSAVGVPAEAALPAALLYRTVTFWLPTVPGWFALHWLQRHDAI